MGLNKGKGEMNDDLLISYLSGNISNEQAKGIDDWRLVSPDNELRFRQVRLIWETSKSMDLKDAINAKTSLEKLKKRIKENDNHSPIVVLKPKYRWLQAVAAVILISGAAWLYTVNQSVKELKTTTNQLVRIDTLGDGSVITLNRNSVLEYPSMFRGYQRQVILTKGEAFFDVAPDKKKPFLVKSGDILIQVVGTSFNVKRKGENLEVIVESGKVQVSKAGQTILLAKGEKILVSEDSDELQKEPIPDELYSYYRTKQFIADDTPLWRMVEALNEAYDSQIVINNPDIENLPLNTTFKNESLDDILQVISRTFQITVEKKQKQIILK